MRIVVTGSAGHLGEGLVRALTAEGHDVTGIDLRASPFTQVVGSITERERVAECLRGVEAVLHTATLHKPHVRTHARREFVETNVSGTLILLEEALRAGAQSFVFTSTTSAFGRALTPDADGPAAWITETVTPRPKNIYGVTKTAAEDLCELVQRDHGLPCIVLRTSRFFPEADDNDDVRRSYDDLNAKANEYLYRRVELSDVVSAHVRAIERAAGIGFGRYIISATTPFERGDLAELRVDAPAVVRRRFPALAEEYERRGWKLFPSIDRVYVNAKARTELGWEPVYDFARVLRQLRANEDPRSELSRAVGSKGYHDRSFEHGPYPVA